MSNEIINLSKYHNNINIFSPKSSKELEIFWIHKRIKNEDIQSYIKDLKSQYEIREFSDLDKVIKQLKKLRFIDTIIIISAGLLADFAKLFKDNLKDIYIIPKIILTDSNVRNYNNEIFQDKFYSGSHAVTYTQLKHAINSYQLNKDQLIFGNNQYKYNQYEVKPIFIQIKTKDDLKLLEYYHKLVDGFTIKNNPNFNRMTFNDYKNDSKYNSLLNQMINVSNIPIELLAKYYARLYSIEGDFDKKMNNYLLSVNYSDNNIIYEPYIKAMYEGINKNIFKTCLGNELFSSLRLPDNEIIELLKYKEKYIKDSKELLKDIPLPVIFSKSFLSFYKDINKAQIYIRYGRNTLLFLNMTTNNEFDLKTHADIEEFSFYPNEKQVLFFPFSAFGFKDIKYNPIESIYNIELIYYGKLNKNLNRDASKSCVCTII